MRPPGPALFASQLVLGNQILAEDKHLPLYKVRALAGRGSPAGANSMAAAPVQLLLPALLQAISMARNCSLCA